MNVMTNRHYSLQDEPTLVLLTHQSTTQRNYLILYYLNHQKQIIFILNNLGQSVKIILCSSNLNLQENFLIAPAPKKILAALMVMHIIKRLVIQITAYT
jgi:hypothetical protein